jgi:hypothetical protein
VPRIFPVADGVLKHQLYYQPGTSTDGVHEDESLLTIWTYKALGSPVAALRITAEQDAIMAWVTAHARGLLPTSWQIIDLRTWDYGLDPAPRTRRVFLPIQGTVNVSGLTFGPLPNVALTWVIAERTQPVGSTIRNRNNGRTSWPITYQSTVGGGTTYVPTQSGTQTAFNALLTALNGAGNVGAWSVVSFVTGGVARITPLVTPVNHLLVQRTGVQRRRIPRAGAYARGT